ncbi:MAG: hypothetical protein KGL74_03150 [Elusimicrobia bacterium]|nr:hypothetical protein [Elusimicrobiota bacterium]
MRLRVFFAVAALASAACGRGPGSSGVACPHDLTRERLPPVEVVVSSVTAVVRRDLDLAQLARLPGTEALGPGGKIQGLTLAEHRLAYKTGIAVEPHLFGGPECAWIDHLTVNMTPTSITIYVPKDYPEDSCESEQVLAHERQHEEIHRDTLDEYAGEMRRALARADWLPARGTPLAVADRAEAERRIEEMVDKAAKPVYARFKETLAERQAVIDVPENYRWVSRRCANWK